jgi:hypothetical protein
VAKNWVRLASRRSLKLKNTQKQGFWLSIFKKPGFNQKHVDDFYKLSNIKEYSIIIYNVYGCILHASSA